MSTLVCLHPGEREPEQREGALLQRGGLSEQVGTIRRVGALLEREGVGEALLLEQALTPTTSLIPWIPTAPERGTVSRRWGVVLNEQP